MFIDSLNKLEIYSTIDFSQVAYNLKGENGVKLSENSGKKSWVSRVLSGRRGTIKTNFSSQCSNNAKNIQDLKTRIYQIRILLSANASPARMQFLLDDLRVRMQSTMVHASPGDSKLIKDFQEMESLIDARHKGEKSISKEGAVISTLRNKLQDGHTQNKEIVENMLSKYIDMLSSPRSKNSIDSLDKLDTEQVLYMRSFIELYHDSRDFYDNLMEERAILNDLIKDSTNSSEKYTEVEIEVISKKLEFVQGEIELFEEKKSSPSVRSSEKLLLDESAKLYSYIARDSSLSNKAEFSSFYKTFASRALNKSVETSLNIQSAIKSNVPVL